MVPRTVAALVGIAGLGLSIASFLKRGEALGRWALRAPILVTLAVVAFGLTIRSPGLLAAGPLVVLVGGAASPETRPRELAIFAVVATAFCVGLFRYALGLPIPILRLPGLFTL
jgi:putative tricarboxylic transport membrane protein